MMTLATRQPTPTRDTRVVDVKALLLRNRFHTFGTNRILTRYRGSEPRRGESKVMLVRVIAHSDAPAWERMRQTLWPSAAGEHAGEIARFFSGDRRDPLEVLLAIEDSGRAVGFAELSIRQSAEGCYSGRVAYLEGWFVEPAARRRGVGSALVKAAEAWGRDQGCTELASDVELGNTASAAAHSALGFAEIVRKVCFRKDL
jgi:aminoglycoside 6'-N-acetyltransferase I